MNDKVTKAVEYMPGQSCMCAAYNQDECACGDDWVPRSEKLVEAWASLSRQELRLRLGECTEQEIRTVRAVLNHIIKNV